MLEHLWQWGRIKGLITRQLDLVAFVSSPTYEYIIKTDNYTVLTTDHTVECSGSIEITLPTAVGIEGKEFTIQNNDTGIVTLKTTSSQTINGQASGTIQLIQYESLTVASNNSNWIIV